MKKLRFFLYSFLFCLIIVLLFLYISPSGRALYRHDFSKNHYNLLGGQGFFHKLGPEERVLKNKIFGDPAYFFLKSPRSFDKARLKIAYRLSSALESEDYLNIETGVLVDKKNWRYQLQPIFNNKINSLLTQSDTWEIKNLSDLDNLSEIYSEMKKSDNLKVFYKKDNKNFEKTLFYNYLPPFNFYEGRAKIEDNFVCFHYDILYNIKNLRGSHSFFTYICDEDLDFKFNFLTSSEELLNSSDSWSIFIYSDNQLIYSEKLASKENLKLSSSDNYNFDYHLKLEDLPNGVYKIDLRLNDNVLIKKIETPINKLSFINRVWLDSSQASFDLYSNKNNFRIKSLNSNCLGNLKINNQDFSIDKIYQQFNFKSGAPEALFEDSSLALNKISSDFGGLLVENNGLFSFSPLSFFNPLSDSLDSDSDLDNYDALVFKYNFPQVRSDYYLSEIEIDLSQAEVDKDGYNFIISAPQLKDLDEEKYIEILSLEIKLEGKSLWRKIKEFIF